MADVTGILHAKAADGSPLALRLTMAGIAKLQAVHGNDLGGLLTGGIDGGPPVQMMLDVLSAALQKGQGLAAAEADDLADDLLTADLGIFERLMRVTFPDLVEGTAGNAPTPAKRRR